MRYHANQYGKELPFAPREVFEQILEYSVMPTFDLVVVTPSDKVILVFRKIAPYNNTWALPGLRMYKTESINDSLIRIADQELGIAIDVKNKELIGQFVGKFKTENNRQDLSTGYVVRTKDEPTPNPDHFSNLKLISNSAEIPKNIGAMYKYYLETYFKTH